MKIVSLSSDGGLRFFIKDGFFSETFLVFLQSSKSKFNWSCELYDYYQEYFHQEDLSFIVNDSNGKMMALVLVSDDQIRNGLGFYDGPIQFLFKDNLMFSEQRQLCQLISKELFNIASRNDSPILNIECDDFLLANFFKNQVIFETEIKAYVNLDLKIKEIKSNLRKSYKSLINWGSKHLQLELITSQNLDSSRFYSFKDFHLNVAQRKTRSDRSWDLQLKSIQQNHAFLLLGYLDQKLVSGAYILMLGEGSDKEAIYGVSVNDRELFKRKLPIGHYIVFKSIEISQNMGCHLFNLGKIGPEFSNEKEKEIGLFKKGFATHCKLKNIVKIPLFSASDEKDE